MKQVVLALQPDFEKQGHKLIVDNDTAGALQKRIEDGEAFDIAVITPGAVDQLAAKGKVAPDTKTMLARVAIGVMVRPGTPLPNISSVDAFKQALLNAKSVAYIDPASGGSSGIYLDKLFEKMGGRRCGARQGQAEARRLCRRSACQRRGRARYPSDQRNRAGEGRRAGRAAAAGNPELTTYAGAVSSAARQGRDGSERPSSIFSPFQRAAVRSCARRGVDRPPS